MMNKVLLLLLLSIACFAQTGSGTEEDPYIITTPEELNNMRNLGLLNKYYELGANIDLSTVDPWTPLISNGSGTFHFDGRGYTISNMHVTESVGTRDQGGFIAVLNGGILDISNLNFDNCNVNIVGNGYLYGTGFLVGSDGASSTSNSIKNIIIRNSSLTVSTATARVGMIAGEWLSGTIQNILIENCVITKVCNSSDVYGSLSGVVGTIGSDAHLYRAGVYNCTFNWQGTQFNGMGVAGVFGSNAGVTYTDPTDLYSCGNTFNVTGTQSTVYFYAGVGGICNYIDGSSTVMSNIYAANNTFNISGGAYNKGTLVGKLYARTGDTVTINNTYLEELSGVNKYTAGIITELTDNSEIHTTAEMKEESTYSGFDFTDIWGISPSYQDGYPFLLGNVLLVLLTPKAGDIYKIPETVEITWVGSAGSNPEVDIEYSTDGGENWNALATGETSPYEWDFSSLGINSNLTKIKLDYNGFEVESKLFTIRALSRYIIIKSPLSLPNITIGSTVTIEVETNNVDSIRIEWSKAQSNWELITKEDTDGSGVSDVFYEWTIPVGISSPFYLRAIEDLDTVIYVWDKELTRIGTTMPSQPQICWKGYQSSPVRTYWSYDQCCGWCIRLNHTSVIATLKDKADGINYSLSTCDGTCDNEIANFIENEDFVTIGNEVKQRRDFYPRGTTVIYKLRRYYTSSTDSTLRMDDLINDIEGIFVADLKPFINTTGKSWIGIPSALQIYHVQQSKIEGKTYSVSFDDFESLNDEDFTPQLLIGGGYFGHGGLLLYKMDLLPEPVSANPLSDIEQVEVTGSIRRTIFRGIHPKATKKLNHEWDKN